MNNILVDLEIGETIYVLDSTDVVNYNIPKFNKYTVKGIVEDRVQTNKLEEQYVTEEANNVSEEYEFFHREKLNLDYSKRFLNGEVTENDYHGPFFFSELSLQDFKKYYGDNMPAMLIQNYEDHVNGIYKENFKYDIAKNRFVKKEKVMQKAR